MNPPLLTRRSFLQAAAAGTVIAVGDKQSGTAIAAKPAPKSPKRLLILGGTGFLGPHVVEAAQKRGLVVTLFNRGKTNPQLFPEIEKLHGDRTSDLSALKGRTWDAVLDTSGYFPRIVGSSADALKGAAGQYLFISSVSVYKDFSKPLDETAPLATIADPTVEKITEESYGALKALCEQTASRAFPGRATLIRPGYIVGPRDSSDRFTYWPVRAGRGGEMLAPGSASDPVQFIDVRDLAAWIVKLVEDGQAGTYNATGPYDSKRMATMGELLAACKAATKSDVRFTYVSADAMKTAGILDEVPIWTPPAMAGMSQVANQRAVATGLSFRPIGTTIEDTLAWWQSLPAERRAKPRAGLTAEQEAKGLALARTAAGKPTKA